MNGPGLAAKNSALAAAWFTGANEEAAVYEAYYDTARQKFAQRVRIDLGNPVGRAQIAILSDHAAITFWVEHDFGVSRLLARRVSADGTIDQPIEIARGLGFGYPHVANALDTFLVTWADEGKASRVHVSQVRPKSFN